MSIKLHHSPLILRWYTSIKASASSSRLRLPSHLCTRTLSTPVSPGKKEGDISSVFVSLSGQAAEPLPARFADLKARLIRGNEQKLQDSWHRLLKRLRDEIAVIRERGSDVIPSIEFKDIRNPPEEFERELRKRGVAVVRGVIQRDEARGFKEEIEEYVRANPWTKAFPPTNPQVFELYWSAPQVRARTHPNLLSTHRFLNSFWHTSSPSAPISRRHPVSYADRCRIRQPGDTLFALGPHVDGGSLERWEENGYGLGGVYSQIWAGKWEEYDPWEASCRLPVVMDLYNGAGACSMFRMFQGWLSMSRTKPSEGTLLVNPLLKLATAYYLLRPFFAPSSRPEEVALGGYQEGFLSAENWRLELRTTSDVQGANQGHCQELSALLHPHLRLKESMVHVPEVNPGDYVAWHCDTIHAVDPIHAGHTDSSVLYIPSCPLTEANAAYLARQRDTFLAGIPAPDFPGGKGESEHAGRPTVEYVWAQTGIEGMRAFGLEPWDVEEEGLTEGERRVVERANRILGFA